MAARLIAQAGIAAAAMPVVGFITGKVVGEASKAEPLLAGMGVVVYAIALAASYAHLRHYYSRFDAPGVRASPFIAFAVELATFYLSFASVVLESRWALFGSLIGAGVVFWGNLTSMALGLAYRAGAEAKEVAEVHAPKVAPAPREEALPHRVLNGESGPAGEAVEAEVGGLAVHLGEGGPKEALDERDQRLFQALRAGPKGPSVLARELGVSPSTVLYRLKRLEGLGLVEKADGVYRLKETPSA
ncbi:MarR family protein [Thermus aquaticus]|uniref:MarR family protein n=2 Tax=Thermus aquaticus TaxID=271 RepID=A0A0M9AED1_THEAQ|nr:winged helix-turn-helix domain-containing protein [Thermus aquaticus]KOX88981.1 MarR family protein [Thermus aquaticus]